MPPTSGRPFHQKLAIYLLGIAVGLMVLGIIQARRNALSQQRQGERAPAEWSPEAVERAKAAAEPIIDAIAAYRESEGRLPPSLEALDAPVPPSPAGDSGWRYVRSLDGSFYYLSFGVDLGQSYDKPRTAHYDSREGEWTVVE